MRVACHLRELRGDRTLKQISEVAGVAIAALSTIERGYQLPRDEWLDGLERAYGSPRSAWYPPTVLLALSGDDA